MGAIIPSGTQEPEIGRHQVALISGPIHYDILIPLDTISKTAFANLSDHGVPVHHQHAKWLVFGWGARDFYTQTGGYSDLSVRSIWRGLTGDASVMRVDVLGPLSSNLNAQTIALSDTQYASLINALRNSFAPGPLQPLPISGFTDTDMFFTAHGSFHIGRTCNVWVGEIMRAAGLRFGIWTPLPLSVRLSHRLYQAR